LVDKYGERQVFIGPPEVQATQQDFGWPELIPITGLQSPVKAIETIVEQGEGTRGNWHQAHYGKFLRIMEEYRVLKQQEPNFEPARPVIAAYVRQPSDTIEVTTITDPITARVSDSICPGSICSTSCCSPVISRSKNSKPVCHC
jgi:hypothetical protein